MSEIKIKLNVDSFEAIGTSRKIRYPEFGYIKTVPFGNGFGCAGVTAE